MKKINYIPLGSVVYLNGGIKKVMVVARAIQVTNGDKQCFFDYGGVLYPEGITGDQMAYFNHDDVSSVFFYGCDDDENKGMVETINQYVANHPDLLRGDINSWNT